MIDSKEEDKFKNLDEEPNIINANIREWIHNPINLTLASSRKIHNSFKKISWRSLISMNRADLVFQSIYADLETGYHYLAAIKILKTMTENKGEMLEKILLKDASFLINCLEGVSGKKVFYKVLPEFKQIFSYKEINEYRKMFLGINKKDFPDLNSESVDYINEAIAQNRIEANSNLNPKYIFNLGAHGRFVIINLTVLFFEFYKKLGYQIYSSKVIAFFHEMILEWHSNVFVNSFDFDKNIGKVFYQHITSEISEKNTLSLYFPCKQLKQGEKRWISRVGLILYMMDLQNKTKEVNELPYSIEQR